VSGVRHLTLAPEALFRRGTDVPVKMLTFMGLSTSRLELEQHVSGISCVLFLNPRFTRLLRQLDLLLLDR